MKLLFKRLIRGLFVLAPVAAVGFSDSFAQSSDSWKVRERSFRSYEELTNAKLEPGVVYRVSEKSSDDLSQGGLFYFITKPLPADFDAGSVTQLAENRFLFRPESQTPEIRAEWFGAAGDGVTDDARPIREALEYFNRVDLLDKTYGVGKGLYIVREITGAVYLNHDFKHWDQSIPLDAGYKVFGMGPHRTKVKLLDNTNPRPQHGRFAVFGSLINRDAANVVIRGLHIDVNFDGQAKEARVIPPARIVDGKTYSLPETTNDVATLNAINIKGSNPLIEDLLITGYSSNGEHEAFVVMTELPFDVPIASNRCATIRNVEMTKPGSNLEIKYRRYGLEKLRENKNYQHIGEITHIAVGGASNFANSQMKLGRRTLPAWHEGWSRVVEVERIEHALAHRKIGLHTVVKVLRPATTYYVYEPTSTERTDEVTSFALGVSLFDVLPGRVTRLPDNVTPKDSGWLFDSVPSMVKTLASLPVAARPPDKTIIRVSNTAPDSVEYYLTQLFQTPSWLEPREYVSGVGPTSGLHFRRIPPRDPTCHQWECDPAHNPAWLGENASNVIFCDGGVVENVYIHDEEMNSEGYSADGVRYGIENPEGINASHLHGITAAFTRGLVVRNNRIENFHGIGFFIMSWWNEGISVERNWFDGVFSAVTLASFVEPGSQKPLQFPRHRGIWIKENYIRLGEFPTSPAGYTPTGLSLFDMASGETFPGSLPLNQHPRFDSIEFRGNRIHGRPYAHVDGELGLIYPLAGLVRSRSYVRDLTITENVVDLRANPLLVPPQNRLNRFLSTSFVFAPGYFYERGRTWRHQVVFNNNRDLLGFLADDQRVRVAFQAINEERPRWVMPKSFPILLNDSWEPYRIGPERFDPRQDPNPKEPKA